MVADEGANLSRRDAAIARGPPPAGVSHAGWYRMDECPSAAPVTVVIVNFSGGDHLSRCLERLGEQTVLPERVIIVDNAGGDGSLAACREMLASRTVLADRTLIDEVGRNIGFAAASNRGIAAAQTPLVALLNPDAFPEPEWLEALVAAAAAHPACAAFGSRQMRDGLPGVIDGLGDHWHASGLSWREGHGRDLVPADLMPRDIFSPCAAAALYRRSALLEVGGFDEDYFCFGEDVDLGYRLRLAGYRAWFVPDAVVAHIGGASTPTDTATFYGHRNTLWTLVKNTPRPLLTVSLLAHGCQSILVGIVLVFRGRGRAFFRGKWAAACALPAAFHKRQTIQAARKVSTWAIWRMIDKGWSRRRRLRSNASAW